jgi:ligand-binding sensor domain-containing protein
MWFMLINIFTFEVNKPTTILLYRALKLIFNVLVVLISNISIAQNALQVESLTTDAGLNFRHINSITQDTIGFMWFATKQGVTKYDGNTFKTFDSNKDNPNFIPYEQASKIIYQKSTHTIWFIANHKLFALNLNNEKLKKINGADEVLKGEVIDIALDKTNNLWIVKDNSTNYKSKIQDLIKYDSQEFHLIKSLKRKSTGFTSIAVTNDNNICWVTVNHGLIIFNQDGQILNRKILESYDWYGNTIHYGKSFFDSKSRHLYFSESKGGVDVYENLEYKYRLIKSNSSIYNAVEDKSGGVWFTGQKELYYVTASNEVYNYSKNINSILDFSHINFAYVDFSDLLWVGTDNGLVKVKLQSQNFEKILKIEDKGWGRTFRDIFPLKGGYIGAMSESENQLYKIDNTGLATPIPLPNSKNSLKDARFFVSDTLLNKAYTVTNYFIEIDFNTNAIKANNAVSPYLNETKSNPLIQLNDKSLLAGFTLSKLIRIDPKTKTFQPVFKNKPDYDYNTKAFLQSEVDPNIVWVGTLSHGLFKVNLDGKVEAHYDISTMPSLSKNHIMALREVNNQILIGTFGGGISVLDLDENTIRVIDEKDGLSDNNVVSIQSQNEDEIIAATYNGLSRINLTTNDIQNYFEQDGISNNEFNYTSSYKSKDGQYYFGGMNGITKFSYDNLSKKRVLPALNFTQLEVFNQQKDTLIHKTKLDGNPVVLSPYDINLKVDWSVPDYFNQENYNYYTIMEGFENKWFYQGNANSIRYNKLPAGKYTLKIKGVDINGNESKAGIEIPITVNQIFYKTWWFITLCIIGISGIVYAFFQYRLNQALALERLRIKISSDLHDDVGSMLTGLAMQTEMLEMQSNNQIDKRKLRKITNLSRNTISHMRDFVWSIDSRRDKLEDLIERMNELAEDLLLPAGISYNIKTSGLNLQKKINLNCRRNLFLIYKEALNNTIKHSNAKSVMVEFTVDHGRCNFNIKDDGVIDQIKYKSGLGLANMKLRTESINAKLEFDLKEGFGINILLPSL